jgi:hypothetical protein
MSGPADRRVVYIRVAVSSLRARLGLEQRTVRGSVRNQSVNVLRRCRAVPYWIRTADREDALVLGRRLIEWHRVCAGLAIEGG